MRIIASMVLLLCTTLMYAQQYPDRHSTDNRDAWLSCQTSESPYKVREEGHWIMYDLGNSYVMHEMTLWNINAYQKTNMGAQEIVVDYSTNGEDWTELGYYTMSEGSASSFYQGEQALNFNGVSARYVLITLLSNYGDTNCSGLAEVRINATIDSTVSVDDLSKGLQQIHLSPNPTTANTLLSVDQIPSGSYNYFISDMSGKVLKSSKIDLIAGDKVPLDLGDLAVGQYVFSLQYGPLVLSESISIIK